MLCLWDAFLSFMEYRKNQTKTLLLKLLAFPAARPWVALENAFSNSPKEE
jgi:hypothetical protein